MKKHISLITIVCGIAMLLSCKQQPNTSTDETKNTTRVVLDNVRVIDGNGGEPIESTSVLIEDGKIKSIGQNIATENATHIDLNGKTIMPALISSHVHIGTLKGTTTSAENYTKENILAQLKKYEAYGVLNILVMGTDRPLLFESGLREQSQSGSLDGARVHTAGYGFGVETGGPPVAFGMDLVFRPTSVEQIPAQMDTLKKLNADIVKMWVDDFNGKAPKMKPEIYTAIIQEAHKRNLRVASHVYYLADLKRLIADGIDVIGHSVRDAVIDDETAMQMKARNIVYIPTLALDKYAYSYAQAPAWINDPFFTTALEPGVYDMITAGKYQNDIRTNPLFPVNVKGFETAGKNVKKLADAGVLIAMGTDSGATPVRAQGFSEHLELELMVEAGLTPSQAITVATLNAAKAIMIDKDFGTLEPGKTADFLVLDANPLEDIKNTRKISGVYKAGKLVGNGPVAKQ